MFLADLSPTPTISRHHSLLALSSHVFFVTWKLVVVVVVVVVVDAAAAAPGNELS